MVQFTGQGTPGTTVDTDIAEGAGIKASKQQHRTTIVCDFNEDDTAGSIAVQDHTVFKADGAGTIMLAKAWLVDSGTNTDIDFDVQINGVTALTAPINIVHGTGDGTSVSGTIASGTLVAGDIVTCTVETVTNNTGATGPRVQISIDYSYV